MADTTSRARAARTPALAAAAVLLVVALAGALAATTGDGGGDTTSGPPPLRLSVGTTDAASSSAAMSSTPSGAYRLDGVLPADGPEQGVVWQLPAGPADVTDVRRLASALGVEGEPRADGDSWTVTDGSVAVTVSGAAGRWWSYGPVQESFPVSAEGVDPSALVPVAEEVAREVAAPVLEALGLDVARARTEGYGNVRGVVVDPDVDALPTQGWSTRVEVGADGALLWASGWLGAPAAGETYPLVSAQAAYDLMASAPHPDIAALCLPDTPCGSGERIVTGARPGLQLHMTDGGAVLVPAWLFDVRDAVEPVGHVAVDPALLAPPEVPEVPDLPVAAPPADGPVERTTFGFDRAARGVQEAEVVVGYGDSSSCPHVGVVPLVEETDETVTVRLEADAQSPERACTADYVGVDLVVPLERPLGDRVLVDGVTGQEHDLPAP